MMPSFSWCLVNASHATSPTRGARELPDWGSNWTTGTQPPLRDMSAQDFQTALTRVMYANCYKFPGVAKAMQILKSETAHDAAEAGVADFNKD